SVLVAQCDDRACAAWAISLIGQERQRTGAVWSAGDNVKVAPDGLRFLKLSYVPAPTLSVDVKDGSPERRLTSGPIMTANWDVEGKCILVVRRNEGVWIVERLPAD